MGTKLTNEENPELQHNTVWMVREKQIHHEKLGKKKKEKERWRAYFKDGIGPCLDVFLSPCGRRNIIAVQNNIYDKYGSQKKLFQPKTLLRPFPPLYLFIWLHHVPCGNLPQPEIEPVPPALKCRALTTGPPGKFSSPYLSLHLNCQIQCFWKWCQTEHIRRVRALV